jgi:hypothetical protein
MIVRRAAAVRSGCVATGSLLILTSLLASQHVTVTL